ncbi:protein dpy-30 homolog [Topomyia yanbarensis]|uniref:protein dpy-30 homolog n=1 Tax=Topomyia yanbarensis TaxID=2498891 RepID=UPI00273B9077|nr:protein dpy-30 homolog [Topomyia yanbarensis]
MTVVDMQQTGCGAGSDGGVETNAACVEGRLRGTPEEAATRPATTQAMEKENKSSNDNGRKLTGRDLQSLPTRQYLDQTVNPILLQGLKALAKDRPQDPVQYLVNFLLKNKSRVDETNGTEEG